MSITYSVCVFAGLVIQHAKRMRRIILSLVCAAPLWLLQPEEEGTNDASELSTSLHGVTSQKARILASILCVGYITRGKYMPYETKRQNSLLITQATSTS
jgi:hypothetical protein